MMSLHRTVTRRHLFWMGLGALGTVASQCSIPQQQLKALDQPDRSFAIASSRPLKEQAAARNLIYGAAARYEQLMFDPDFADRLTEEASILVPEWELKWTAGDKTLRPGPNTFDFPAPDAMAKFAQERGLLLRGHTLIWHDSLPQWFDEFVTPQNAQQVLTHHIETVAGRYAGQMHSWDVVNEAIAYDPRKSRRADRLRLTPWLKFLGPEYIDLAFRTAAAADPKALRVYNDFGLDYNTPRDTAKRAAVLQLLRQLKAQGTPIDALGIQAHLRGDATEFNPQVLRQFLKDVAALDLKILITELDVADDQLPPAVEVRDRIVAGAYEDYLSVVLDEPAVIAVITWGLSDRYTYLSEFHPRADGLPVRPLPLDQDLKPKLAWNAIARAITHAPQRIAD